MKGHHKHAPWRKSVLVPFWTLQLLLVLLMIALLGLAEGLLVSWDENGDSDSDLESAVTSSAGKVSKIVVPVWLVLATICLILTITEIVLLARYKLKPAMFVVMNTIKTGIWTIIFVLDVVSAVDDNSRTASAIAIIIEALLYLCFLIPLIYGSIIYHRTRREKKTYAPVVDPNAPTEYPSQYQNFVAGSHADVERGPVGTRRLSYNHERDTRFDAYQQRRSVSYGDASMGDIGMGERAVGAYERDRKVLSVGSPEIPMLVVEHHDGEVYEMENTRRTLS